MVLNPIEPKIYSNLVRYYLIQSQFNQLSLSAALALFLTIVESLHTLVNSSVGGAGGSTTICLTGGTVGPVCLPRRAETFGGFDSHQMNSSKSKTFWCTDRQTFNTLKTLAHAGT